MPSVAFFYCYALCHYAGCLYASCRYAECRSIKCPYAECRYAECHYSEFSGAVKDQGVYSENFLIMILVTFFMTTFLWEIWDSQTILKNDYLEYFLRKSKKKFLKNEYFKNFHKNIIKNV